MPHFHRCLLDMFDSSRSPEQEMSDSRHKTVTGGETWEVVEDY